MATIAVMIGGAILNATTFIGGSYLAKYFSGDDASVEKKRLIRLWKNIRRIMQSTKEIERNYLIGKSKIEEIRQSLLRILKTQTKL